MKTRTVILRTRLIVFLLLCVPALRGSDLRLNDHDYLEAHGLSVLLFHNAYHQVFGDQKMGGLEIILHEQRIATDGDVRLSPTPAQGDPIPQFVGRKRGPSANQISASYSYAALGLTYSVQMQPEADGFRVLLDHPLPPALVGKAGFNLEFLPTTYFGKTFIAGDTTGVFPRHSIGGKRPQCPDNAIQVNINTKDKKELNDRTYALTWSQVFVVSCYYPPSGNGIHCRAEWFHANGKSRTLDESQSIS